MRVISRRIVALMLGVIVPAIILFQSMMGLSALSASIKEADNGDLISLTGKLKSLHPTGNDYSFVSLINSERANKKVMISKQIMKVSVMQIGFAVISLGMMLIVLGINDGGIDTRGNYQGMSFDLKTGSSGIVIFLVGAGMASAGGILKNDYSTVQIPQYLYVPQEASGTDADMMHNYQQCKQRYPAQLAECFTRSYEAACAKEIQ